MAEPAKTERPHGYTVMARKYRPRRFADIVGQPHVVQALTNALSTGRLAHAFLLTGSRGTGKTSTARILASALNCMKEGRKDFEPCGECPSCVDISGGEDMDVIEMDAASNSRVDDIRERLLSIDTKPARGRFRIYIIDEVHMLSTSAFNALLKTIEEPPAHVKFILATTNPEKIPETILSRVQRYDFRRVTLAEITERLQSICAAEGLTPEPDVLRTLAELSEGGLRDALSRLDQLAAFAGAKATLADAERVFGLVSRGKLLTLLESLSKGDLKAGILFAEDVFDSGKDAAEVLGAMVGLTRALLLVAAAGNDTRGVEVMADELPRLREVGARFGIEGLVYLAEMLTDCRQRVRRAAFPRVVVETTMVKLAMLKNLKPLDQLIAQLESPEFAQESFTKSEGPGGANERAPETNRHAAPVTDASNFLAPARDSLQKAVGGTEKTVPTVAQDNTKTGPNDARMKRAPTEEESQAIGELRRKFRAK
ncbi:MAG: DNA polymerase III subunit gamma/tau [Planctomycetes bacterium]|nr:DNA polymerase III subunit gamma/tau [Planctomycetota bacterium]